MVSSEIIKFNIPIETYISFYIAIIWDRIGFLIVKSWETFFSIEHLLLSVNLLQKLGIIVSYICRIITMLQFAKLKILASNTLYNKH